jgi:hypothetical protein
MHPIEHLRYIARATGADPALIAREAGEALVDMARVQPAGLVPACRRLIERHVSSGPVWWLSARMLRSDDPARAGRDSIYELDSDRTSGHLADALGDAVTALVLGWPDVIGEALRQRGDVEVLIVEWAGEGEQFARRLGGRGSHVCLVPESGVGPAAVVADVVLIEALAAGPAGVLAVPGSMAAAAVAMHQQVPVWAVAGVGRALPEQLWDSLVERLDQSGEEPWDRDAVVVPADLLSQVIGPTGVSEVGAGLRAATCPPAPELFRAAG